MLFLIDEKRTNENEMEENRRKQNEIERNRRTKNLKIHFPSFRITFFSQSFLEKWYKNHFIPFCFDYFPSPISLKKIFFFFLLQLLIPFFDEKNIIRKLSDFILFWIHFLMKTHCFFNNLLKMPIKKIDKNRKKYK